MTRRATDRDPMPGVPARRTPPAPADPAADRTARLAGRGGRGRRGRARSDPGAGRAAAPGSARARRCLPTLADLVDELTINQIKQVLLPDGRARFGARMEMLAHDVDLLLATTPARLTARLVRILVVLAQMNLHIWTLKERAQAEPARYMEHLKLAHQLNGLRNRMKNALLDALGDDDPALRRSNCDTDGLAGWDVRID